MSPLVHGELSWLLSQSLRARRDRVLVTCAGLAPDLDGLTLLGGEDLYAEWHHVLFHGFPGAFLVASVCALGAAQRLRTAAWAFVAFHLHILCDLVGSGPGWPILYFWPFGRTEWFWDGQWDLASWQNAVIGLAVTLGCLSLALFRRRTVLEVVSPRWDAVVVATLRARFLKEPLPGASNVGAPVSAAAEAARSAPERDRPPGAPGTRG